MQHDPDHFKVHISTLEKKIVSYITSSVVYDDRSRHHLKDTFFSEARLFYYLSMGHLLWVLVCMGSVL